MLDKKWIKANPEAFDKAMRDRNCPELAISELICLLIELEDIDKQIQDLKNSIKKNDAKLFHLLKEASKIVKNNAC